MIVGFGIYVVDIARFADLQQRQPRFLDRVLTQREQGRSDGSDHTAASLAARFAAKEALAKALGGPAGLSWHDCEVLTTDAGAPELHLQGNVADAAANLGATRWHVSLSHDGGMAIAMVVLEGP